MMKTLLALSFCLAVAGCATQDPNAEARETPVYRTGSHLPARDGGPIEISKPDPTGMRVPNTIPTGGVRGGG